MTPFLPFGYRAFENTSKKLTQRQLRALGCRPDDEDGRYYPPSDSTFQRVLKKIEADRVAAIMGLGWPNRRSAPWPAWPSTAKCRGAAAVTLSRVFPPLGQWEKEHGRIDHRRVARVAVSPEAIGLCGCWQVIAVERESIRATQPDEPATREIGYYTVSMRARATKRPAC
jgi:hypothetical protein